MSSKWAVVHTPEFEQELKDIYSYIANTLLVPDTAKKQVLRIFDVVESLDTMPLALPLYNKEPWSSKGLRKIVVDNFIIFFMPNEKTKEVYILHIFYGGRNIDELL